MRKSRAILVHSAVRGRARFQVDSLYRDWSLARKLEAELSGYPGVIRARVHALTGSVLVVHDSNLIRLPMVTRRLNQLLRQGKVRDQSQESYRVTSTSTRGLSSNEVRQRLRVYGLNRIPIMPPRSSLSIFLDQFNNLPTSLLIASSLISLVTGGVPDAIVILGVVAINSTIGFQTEFFAEKTISSLIDGRSLTARVVREGIEKEIPVEQVTLGDLLILVPGITIAADAEVISSTHLSVDESILTGESIPVSKSPRPSRLRARERSEGLNSKHHPHLVFRGTQVTGGKGLAVVTAIGAFTEIGKIQYLMGQSSAPETPLQRRLDLLGRQMVYLSLGLSGLILIAGRFRGLGLRELWKTSLSLMVAAIPESLPTIATTTLARGVKKLHQKGILVRHLGAVEALSEVNFVCLDKTGTLTLNRMTVVRIVTVSGEFWLETKNQKTFFKYLGRQVNPLKYSTLKKLFETVSLCNEADIGNGDDTSDSTSSPKGSSTETALLTMVKKSGMDPEEIRKSYPLLSMKYRSERQGFMSSEHILPRPQGGGGVRLLAVKGRPDQVLELCVTFQKGQKEVPLTSSHRELIKMKNKILSQQGLRVLGVAYRVFKGEVHENGALSELPVEGLVWIGLVAMMDPIRSGMIKTIRRLHEAGIRTSMITGDQKGTAVFIGKKLGLSGSDPMRVFDASNSALQEGLRTGADRFHVFSRISPSAKLQIIQALQRSGQVIAMIGDGVNDGPALKVADVGIAMGANGSETATRVADLVLKHDDLGKILVALREGRTVRDDIHKAVNYILTQNLAEILFTFISIVSGMGEPLSAMQFLWMNLVTDIFPELALAQDPPSQDILRKPPPSGNRDFLGKTNLSQILLDSSLLTLSTLAGNRYAQRKYGPGSSAKTVSFLTLVTGSLLYSLGCRSEHPVLSDEDNLPPNKYLPASVVAGLLSEVVSLSVPRVRSLLGSGRIEPVDLFFVGVASVLPLIIKEVSKLAPVEKVEI